MAKQLVSAIGEQGAGRWPKNKAIPFMVVVNVAVWAVVIVGISALV